MLQTNLTVPDVTICPAIYSKSPTENPTMSPALVPTPSLPTPTSPTAPVPAPTPTTVTPPSGTQPPDGCYWVGPAYPKGGGKGKGSKGVSAYSSGMYSKGSSGPKTKKSHSKKSKGKGSGTPPSAKGKGGYAVEQPAYVVEDVFTEYEADEERYYYDYDYGDYYWCPPGYGTIAPSWPKGEGGSGDYSKPTGGHHNSRPMQMHTSDSLTYQSAPDMFIGSNGAFSGVGDYDASDGNIIYNSGSSTTPEQGGGTIYSQYTPPATNYWAAPPSDTSSTSSGAVQ
jgi:hypothetical protein